MARRYLVQPLPHPGPTTLEGDAAKHLATVMRVRPGEVVVLFDGQGRECDLEVSRAERRRIHGMTSHHREVFRGATRRIELAVALPTRNRASWLFEHGTELGVDAFRPLIAARSQPNRGGHQQWAKTAALEPGSAKPAASKDGETERWERVVAAAAGQCDRSHLPRVLPPMDLEATLEDPQLPAERWVTHPVPLSEGSELEGRPTQLDPAPQPPMAAVVFVGPPGGWTDEELSRLATADARAMQLGPLTLRTETAALVAIAKLLIP